MVVSRDRRPAFYISSDAFGSYWSRLTDASTGSSIEDEDFQEGFDIHCPRHVTPGSGDDTCRVLFSPYDETSLDGRLRACSVRFTATTFETVACSTNFGANSDIPVTLVDYGTGTPSGQRSTRSWIMSVSYQKPHQSTYWTNSVQYLYDHTGSVFSWSDRVKSTGYGDRNSCTAHVAGEDRPKTYFGGSAVDYCEDCDRVVRIDWGKNYGGVPTNTCF